MIDHASLGSQHYAAAVEFYRLTLCPIGVELLRDTGKEAAFGRAGHWGFFLYPAATTPTAPGLHMAFAAASRDEVASAHAAALAAGGTDLFTPRERPDISPSYFGAMFTDLDGHRIEVLTHAAG